MSSADDDALYLPSVFDAADREDDAPADPEDGSLGFLAPEGQVPRSVGDWIGRIDWPRALPAVVAAETALTELAVCWRRSFEKEAILRTWLVDEAVGRARFRGYVSSRQRVIERLLLLDTEDPEALERYIPMLRIAPGDGFAVREIATMRPGWLAAGQSQKARVEAAFGDAHDSDAVKAWLEEAGSGAAGQPAVVFAAAALWSLVAHHPKSAREPYAASLAVAPVLLQAGRPKTRPPLGLARAFMDRPVRWSPYADPQVWLERFAGGVSRAAQLALGELTQLEARVSSVRAACDARRSNSRLADVGALAAREELMTVARIRRKLGWRVSDRGVRKMLAELTSAGFVHEITGRRRFRVYAHTSVSRADLYLGGTGSRGSAARSRGASAPSPTPADGGDLDALMRDADRARERLEALRREALVGAPPMDAED